MSLTTPMKKMLRNMTQKQIDEMFEAAGQPRLTTNLTITHARGKGKKKLGRAVASDRKNSRPLNSYMAFRSYYSTVFHGYQQKEISGFLTTMWQSDPFKAKWSLLAKAYSLIRDKQGRDDNPLDQFLAITGSLIGVITPGQYLQALGWEITTDNGNQTVMRRHIHSLDQRFFLTNFSVNDLIRHCSAQGFFFGNLAEVLSSDNESVMAMASSAQSASASENTMRTQLEGIGAGFVNELQAGGSSNEGRPTGKKITTTQLTSVSSAEENAMQVPRGFIDFNGSHNLPSGSSVVESGHTTTIPTYASSTGGAGGPSVGHQQSSSQTSAAPTAAAVHGHNNMNTASSLAVSNFHLNSQYPFNAEFDPNSTGMVFDPYFGNPFDPFEMSDYDWTGLVDFDS